MNWMRGRNKTKIRRCPFPPASYHEDDGSITEARKKVEQEEESSAFYRTFDDRQTFIPFDLSWAEA